MKTCRATSISGTTDHDVHSSGRSGHAAATAPRAAPVLHAATALGAATALALGLLVVPPVAASQQPTWINAEGDEVTFASEAAVVEFLENAEIVDVERIPIGVTSPHRVVLEADGIRLSAAFRSVDENLERVRMSDGSFFMRLRDYCGFEVAAYRVSRMLGMDSVPVATMRTVRGDEGTIQLWVESARMEDERRAEGLRSPDTMGWMRQTQMMLVFDDLIGNVDRNAGNILIDESWKVWLIDHTRAFQQHDELRNAERIRWVRRDFWEAMQQLDDASVRDAVGDLLDRYEIAALLERRDLLVAHIEELIASRGEGAVLFE